MNIQSPKNDHQSTKSLLQLRLRPKTVIYDQPKVRLRLRNLESELSTEQTVPDFLGKQKLSFNRQT